MSESSSTTGCTYRAFLSYSHADRAWADWLHKALETYRVPTRLVGTQTAHGTIPRRLNPIFRDREELASATDLGVEINEALRQSENLIVICSPAAAASRWVNEEVLAYKRMGRGRRIFCLVVAGEPGASDLPGRERDECFCPALRFALEADGRASKKPAEPIAADVRRGKDGKVHAKLKLIAGILGVGFDTLMQREHRRRMQRMAAVTAIAMMVMAMTIVLAIFALVSRRDALIARHNAEVAQQAAERRQKQAEGLVSFMLGDLDDKLQQLGRLDTMQAVADRAMSYFASLPATDISDIALVQRAKTLEKIGSIRMAQGQLPGALEAFKASTGISSRLAASAPGSVARQVAYSRTLAFIGMVHWNQDMLADAQRNFEVARQTLQPSLEGTPDDLALMEQVAFLDNNLDHVLAAQGKADEAEAMASERLAIDGKLLTVKPDEPDYMSDLGDAHNELGRLALMRGDLATAIAEYRADDAIQTLLAGQHPGNNAQQERLLWIRAILGRTLALTGDMKGGMRALRQAVDIAEELMQFDPGQTDWQDAAALYSTQLARLERLGGNYSAAKALVSRSLKILAGLVKKDPSNAYWQGDLAGALTEQAAQSRAAGQIGAAWIQVQAALQILEPMLAKHPDQRDTLLATMRAKLLLADVSAGAATAQTLQARAVQTMQAQAANKDDPRLLALQAEALLAMDRASEGRPLIERLWQSGYRDSALVDALQLARIEYPVNKAFQKLLAANAQTKADPSPASAQLESHP